MSLKIVKNVPVRVGVVGCGVVSDYGHIPAIHRSPLAKLVGFADPNPERRNHQAEKYGLPAFASFAELAEKVPMDAVSIPTQPNVKLDMIRIAAAHGLHAFCEKPLTETAAQAQELMKLMDEAGLFVGMSFVYRGKKIVQRMMELVKEGAIGKLRAVHIENMWDYHGLRDQAIRGERRHRALMNHGTLDCGVHDLDLARYLSGGDFKNLSAVGTIVEAANTYPDHLSVVSQMTSGVMVTIQESAVWGYTAKDRPVYPQAYRMVGENGILSCDFGDWGKDHQSSTLQVVSGPKQWSEQLSADKAWDDTYGQFFQIILGQTPRQRFLADGHDALINMQVADEVIAQCRKGM